MSKIRNYFKKLFIITNTQSVRLVGGLERHHHLAALQERAVGAEICPRGPQASGVQRVCRPGEILLRQGPRRGKSHHHRHRPRHQDAELPRPGDGRPLPRV